MSKLRTPSKSYLAVPVKKTTLNPSILKEKNDGEDRTPLNSIRDRLKKINDGHKLTPVHSTVYSSLNKLVTTPHHCAHFESHLTVSNPNSANKFKPQAKQTPNTIAYKAGTQPLSTSKKEAIAELNPVVNGVDYSDVIGRKQELGYSGPGYIVEWSCDPKYLKGIFATKGFWRVNTRKDYKPEESCFDLGPAIFLQRLDQDPNKETPSKSFNNYHFSWRPTQISSTEKSYINATNSLNLETHPKIKKSLKWAMDLESVADYDVNATPTNEIKPKKLRKSFSHSDMMSIINLSHEIDNQSGKGDSVNHNALYEIPKINISSDYAGLPNEFRKLPLVDENETTSFLLSLDMVPCQIIDNKFKKDEIKWLLDTLRQATQLITKLDDDNRFKLDSNLDYMQIVNSVHAFNKKSQKLLSALASNLNS